jgi:hypothetical protein
MFLTRQLRAISNHFQPFTEFIIFNQESHLSVHPILCVGRTTLLFKTPCQQNAQDKVVGMNKEETLAKWLRIVSSRKLPSPVSEMDR